MKLSDLESEYAPRAAAPRLAEAVKRQREQAEARRVADRRHIAHVLAQESTLTAEQLPQAGEALAQALGGRVRQRGRRG